VRISTLWLGAICTFAIACGGADPSSDELSPAPGEAGEAEIGTPAEENASSGESASAEEGSPDVQTLANHSSRGNGTSCAASIYNCKLRPSGGNRIAHVDGSLDWGVERDVPVLDGNGDLLAINKTSTLKFNYGTRRSINGIDHVYAMSTTNRSSGWFPLDSVKSADVLAGRVGRADAQIDDLEKMACYQVWDGIDDALASKKVVYDTKEPAGPVGEAAGDYLSRVRANGKRSINLAYSVPGLGLGSPAVDHFPVGTKFQRLNVPTDRGRPSLDIPLYKAASNGHFTVRSGDLKFVYGYVVTKQGVRRAGWIAYDALRVSSGCQ